MLSVNQLKLTDGGYQQGAAASQDKEETGDGKGDKDERPVESRGVLMIRDELLNSTHKFLGHIDRTLQQLEGVCVSVYISYHQIVPPPRQDPTINRVRN